MLKDMKLRSFLSGAMLALAFSSCAAPAAEQCRAIEICHKASPGWDPAGFVPYELSLAVTPIPDGEALVEYGSCTVSGEEAFVLSGTDSSGFFHQFAVDVKVDLSTPDFPSFGDGQALTVSGVGQAPDGSGSSLLVHSDDNWLVVQSRGPIERGLEGLDVSEGTPPGRSWFADCRSIDEVSVVFSEDGRSLEVAPGDSGVLNGKTFVNFASGMYEASDCFNSLPTGFIVSWAAWD